MSLVRTIATPPGAEPRHVEMTPEEAAAFEAGRIDPFDLATAVARAKRQIDKAAEDARLTWITPGSGQALVYQHKLKEAEDLPGGGGGRPEDHPLLAASIGIEGDTLEEIAAVVLATRSQWLTVAAAIERARLGAKHALDALRDGATAEDVDAIVAGAVFPVSGETA